MTIKEYLQGWIQQDNSWINPTFDKCNADRASYTNSTPITLSIVENNIHFIAIINGGAMNNINTIVKDTWG
jgi:hypothetical protein